MPEGNGAQQAMGEAGSAMADGENANTLNPAQLYYMRQVNIEGILRTGAKAGHSDSGSVRSGRVEFQHFSLTMPVAKPLTLSLGIRPFSAIDYSVSKAGLTDGTTHETYNTFYKGSGTLTQAYLAAGLKLAPGLTVGAQTTLWFGTLQRYTDVTVGYNAITDQLNSRVHDYQVKFGAAYRIPIKAYRLSISAVADLPKSLATSDYILRNRYNSVGSLTSQDTLQAETRGHLQAPQTFRFGLAFEKPRHYVFVADFMHDIWSKTRVFGTVTPLSNTWRGAIGTEWIPNSNGIEYTSYMRFRAGAYVRQMPFNLDGAQVRDVGLTMGIGWPVLRKEARYTRPLINTNFSIGTRQIPSGSGYHELYVNFTLGLVLNDSQWFVRYKID
jgi:hypothetical protein